MTVRISELNELSVDLSQSDVLPIVDISAAETKQIKVSSLLEVGVSGAPSSFIDLSKLNQSSTTKLTSSALADTGVASGVYGGEDSVAQFVVNSKGLITTAGDVPIVIAASSVTGLAPVATSGTYESLAGLPTLGTLSSQDANSVAISGGTISNITDLAIDDGGTGASDAAGARTNLGLVIGTNVQAYDPGLSSIAGLATSADQLLYLTGSDSYDTSPLPSYSRDFLASGNSASGARTVLGLGTLAVKNTVASGDIDAAVISGVNISPNSLTFDNYGDGSVVEVAIADEAVTANKIATSGVTATKLADNSSTIVDLGAPIGIGAFIGQQYQDSATNLVYVWDGDTWERQAALSTVDFVDSTPIAFAVTYPDNFTATVTTTLENQTANTVFAGPSSGAADVPTFRAIEPADLPIATDATVGAIVPGAGLAVDGAGVLNHSNTAAAGTYAGAVTIDAQGHIVTAQALLQASDIPALDASKITTGTFDSAFLAENSVTASQLADYGIAQVSESAPVPEFAGQWWINPNDRSAYIWVGEVTPVPNGYWLNLGYGSPTQINLRFGGTYNASGNIVESINSYGIEAGLTIGQQLSSPNTSNNGVYLIVTSSGVGITPAPTESLTVGNWVLSQGVGANWTKVNLASAVAGVGDQDVLVDGGALIPVASGVATQEDLNVLVWARVQIANASTAGIVRASSTITVASGTGIMSVGVVDDGSY
jgi:hypothetical protein